MAQELLVLLLLVQMVMSSLQMVQPGRALRQLEAVQMLSWMGLTIQIHWHELLSEVMLSSVIPHRNGLDLLNELRIKYSV